MARTESTTFSQGSELPVSRWRSADLAAPPPANDRSATPTLVPESDEVILERLQQRDLTALDVLYERYSRLALGLAYRMLRDQDTAADVLQEAFLSAWRQAASYDASRGNARTWLLSIVRHRCIDHLRRARAAGEPEALDEALADHTTPSVFETACRSLGRRHILLALGHLPAEQRQVVELAYFGGLTHVEIAAIQRVPLGTVKGRMRIGLQKLRGLLAGTEADTTA